MRNKHLLSVLFIALSCVMYGCGAKSAEATNQLPTDSVVCESNNVKNVECKITVDCPTGDDQLSLSVASFIKDELGRQYLPLINDIDGTSKYKPYNGDAKDGKGMVEYYVNGTTDYMREQLKELMDAEMDELPTLEYEMQIRKAADNDRYVSYRVTSYTFLGGAHGSAADYTVNIAKASGKVLRQTVDTLAVKRLQPILRKGVLRYFHGQGETEITESNVGDYLFLQDGIIPLPVHAPYLADDGVHFIYQSYEIGPYAMGMVEFTVPFADIKPYLTQEALGLIKQ